ncbi:MULTISPECIES: tail assembly chaperone [Enterococcus]|uniref:Tail assembly chaperone n=1 Tax=Enterococcus raffinosus TaxID=71452 RepID=A0AAW8THN6_9ENTE|nr:MULTISPECIES: tail assembly chaperone [Enterococcus]MDT2424219.1 tail assembly chaperone [Enterococcus avium]MDT2525614.1 tail assembly chaperone [Enterococcus raffinosus]MDT2536118.1 tail assembly chaperone [Enterococcus raffinosus]MDT2546622.1 tail assembly chaperone [Enterococcus raffinosus]MDT2557101.1 tail assembly chaperone [Enterococcus raffinosus]
MEQTINGKEYKFIFGFGFIQELNRRYSVEEQGMTIKMGLDTVLANFFNKDVETLVEILKVANQTESPKISVNDLAGFVEEVGSEKLFDEVLEELKKSEFTKAKTNQLEEMMKNV